jgi:hypothetical protein
MTLNWKGATGYGTAFAGIGSIFYGAYSKDGVFIILGLAAFFAALALASAHAMDD